jgi:hypothetical protein
MKFKQFLTESRSKSLKENEAYTLIHKHCKQALKAYKDNYVIYRGIFNPINEFLYIDPKKGKPRRSANTQNYYTLLIDNSPYWKDYPKRSQSIICTTSYKKAMSFDTVYEVFLYDGAKIGICPEDDFWFSFENTLGSGNSLDYFNYRFEKMANNFDVNINDSNWKTFKKTITNINDEMKKAGIDNNRTIAPFKTSKEDLLENLFDLLEPTKNNFKVTTNIKDIGKKSHGNGKEIWTDSKAIMIKSFFGAVGGLNQYLIDFKG